MAFHRAGAEHQDGRNGLVAQALLEGLEHLGFSRGDAAEVGGHGGLLEGPRSIPLPWAARPDQP